LNLHDVASAWDRYDTPFPKDSITWNHGARVNRATEEAVDTLTISVGELREELEVLAMEPLGAGWTARVRCDNGDVNVPGSTGITADSAMIFYTIDSILGDDVGLGDDIHTARVYALGRYEAHIHRTDGSRTTISHLEYSVRFEKRSRLSPR